MAKLSRRKTFSIGRDARTGQFITVEEAKRRPATTVVERIPKAGYGDTGRPARNKKGTGSGGPRTKGRK